MADIKYNKSTQWLQVYVESVAHLVPIHKIDSIKGYRVVKDKEAGQDGAIHKDLNTKRFTVTLRTQIWDVATKKYKNIYIANSLETLAHELSHCVFWTHDADHFILQSEIQVCFGKMLKKLAIPDTSERFK